MMILEGDEFLHRQPWRNDISLIAGDMMVLLPIVHVLPVTSLLAHNIVVNLLKKGFYIVTLLFPHVPRQNTLLQRLHKTKSIAVKIVS